MTDLILIAVILGILVAALWYIRAQKKKGAACIGCPHAGSCGKNCGCNKGPLV